MSDDTTRKLINYQAYRIRQLLEMIAAFLCALMATISLLGFALVGNVNAQVSLVLFSVLGSLGILGFYLLMVDAHGYDSENRARRLMSTIRGRYKKQPLNDLETELEVSGAFDEVENR